MEQLVDTIIKINFEDLEHFDFPIGFKFGLSVMYKSVEYEFLVHFKKDSDKVVCLGSGNKADDDPHDNTRPYFHRWSWNFNESTIWYNDPTRYLSIDLPGAWGVGLNDDYYLRNIGEIIVKLVHRLNMTEKNLFFYGSSMGGFTSLQLATMFRESTAIADIPQFFFQNHVRFDHVTKYAFPGLSKEYIMEHYKYRFDFLDMIVKEDYIPKAIIVIDCSDRDINTQYIDFVKGINKLPNITNKKNHMKIVFNYISSHAPLDIEKSYYLVNETTAHNLLCYFDELEESDLFKENEQIKIQNNEFKDVLIKWGEDLYNNSINKEQNDKINYLTQELNKKENTINNLNLEIEKQQEILQCLYSSNSWKITKPLRNIKKFFKRFK